MRPGFDHIQLEAVAARFGHGALENFFRAAAPQPDLDAMGLFEGRIHGAELFGDGRGIERDKTFFPRPGNKARTAIGAAERGRAGFGGLGGAKGRQRGRGGETREEMSAMDRAHI
jgi:hypothetical protein